MNNFKKNIIAKLFIGTSLISSGAFISDNFYAIKVEAADENFIYSDGVINILKEEKLNVNNFDLNSLQLDENISKELLELLFLYSDSYDSESLKRVNDLLNDESLSDNLIEVLNILKSKIIEEIPLQENTIKIINNLSLNLDENNVKIVDTESIDSIENNDAKKIAPTTEEDENSNKSQVEQTPKLLVSSTALITADEFYKSTVNANTASEAWVSAIEFKESYPEDKRISDALNKAAERVLSLGQSYHRSGKLSSAITLYKNLVNEPMVSSVVRNSSAKLMNLAENGKNMPYSSTLYKQTINANTASEAWSKALEFKEYYPTDNRLSTAINKAAERVLSLGQSYHRSGKLSSAITLYKNLVNEPMISSVVRNSSAKLMNLAENGKNMPYSSTLYKQTINANTASEAWSKALEFKEYYPTDNRLSTAINKAAERVLSLGQSYHRSGKLSSAITLYKNLVNEPMVSSVVRNSSAKLMNLAENGKNMPYSSTLYKQTINANTASEAWSKALEFKEYYPTDNRLSTAINKAAERVLSLGQSYHRSGKLSSAITLYKNLVNEPMISSVVRNSSAKLMNLAENGKNMPYSSTLYKQTINANTASEAWSKALEFKEYYPKDSHLSIAINNAANRIFSMGQSSHRLGDFNTAMTYYKMLLIENKVDSQLRNVVSRYDVLAENGSKLLTVSGYVSNSKKASTASESWNIALEGKLVFPNSSNINNAVEDAAQRLLKLARSYQRSGNKSGALTYYNMVINENAVLNDTKDLAHMYSKQLLSNFIPTVYIDPGHGGSDPGAKSSNVTEASLNLSTANYLKNYLESRGYNVVMSRNSNNFLSLAERAQEANELKVDAFVSIHYNAMGIPNSTASGIETYIYHRVASGFGQENNRDNFNTDNSRINESLLLADKTHANLISSTGLYNRGVKGNNFHVVRETNIPAVLYELGFMDNAIELAKIRTSQYQKTAAQAIGKGIVQYFNQLK